MEAVSRQSILIIEPNEQLREEIFNFLLSAGYGKTGEADSLAAAYETASSPAGPLSAHAQKSGAYVSPLIENAYRGARGLPHRCCRDRERVEEKS
jgi:hypothetical protein